MKTLVTLLLMALIFFSCFYCVKEVIVPAITHMTKNAADNSKAFTLGAVNE